MIIRPHDAGTELRLQPHPSKPGLDLGRYLHGGGAKGWEFYWTDLADPITQRKLNDTMRDIRDVPFRSWRPGMPSHMWIDNTTRHQTIEGWYVKLWQRDEVTGGFYPCPAAPHTWLDITYEPPIIDPWEVTSRTKRPTEVATEQATVANPGIGPGELVRAPLQNETEYTGDWRGYTHLKDPIIVDLSRAAGPNVLIEVPDECLLWAPQDWRRGEEWYRVENAAGEILPGSVAQWLSLRRGGKYRIHLRPRLWRWEVFVLAHYAWITLFEYVPNDEYFTSVHFDRPPVYPYRHDVIHTKASQGSINWNGQWRSYDIGIDYTWEHTDAAARLSHQMLEQQYRSPSIAYVFNGNEDPDLYLAAWPARKGDIVAAIERVDEATGASTPLFVRQVVDLDSVYPTGSTFGSYLLHWRVAVPI